MVVKMKLIDTINVQEIISNTAVGIFGRMYLNQEDMENPTLPWLTDEFAFFIDMNYYTIHSADKKISKIYERYRKWEDDGTLDIPSLQALAYVIVNKFKDKWNKLYTAFIESNYKPLENYDMKEKEIPNLTRTKNVKMKTETANDVYGFNSNSTPVPQSKSTNSGNKLDNEEEETNTGTRELERHGNIGVTTSQQMLQSEIDLRKNFNFMNEIMNDVDSVLCLLVY